MTDDPGGGLLVTPSGSVTVSTDDMLAAADRLGALDEALSRDIHRLLVADAIAEGMPVHHTVPPLESVRALCTEAREALSRAATAYTIVDRYVEERQREINDALFALLGMMTLPALIGLIAFAPHTLIGAAVAWALIPDDGEGKLATLRDFFLQHPELVTSPEFAGFVSRAATGMDDYALGVAGAPPWLAALPWADIGPAGGLTAGALGTITLGTMLGMFRETPVAVERVSSAPLTAAPTGVRERLDRIPEVDQVRIEKYEADGMPPRYVVYIGPTETFSPFAGDEPWDLTSNVHGVAGLSPGSLRAVELAMTEAGITATDEVMVTGFSQGGLLATMVAASEDWNVVAAETHAAPAGNISLPDGLNGLAIRHTDDFIPALAGPQTDSSLVQVEREAFAGDAPIPTDQAAPAHQRVAYERTASAIDTAESAVVRDEVRFADDFTADYLTAPGGQATVMTFHADRVDPVPVPSEKASATAVRADAS